MAAYELTKTILKNSSSLKAYYQFESGALTTDSSGNSNTLSDYGTPSETTGKFGGGVSFNGSNNGYNITDTSILKPTSSFSIGCWVNFTVAQSGTTPSLFQSFNYASSTYAGIKLTLDYSTGKKIEFLSSKNTGAIENTDWKKITSPVDNNDGVWHLAVGTWDGSTMRLYIDSSMAASTSWANAPVYRATNYPAIGTERRDSGYAPFNGSLDDVFLFNGTALSADQIKELYEGRYIGEWMPQANLVGLWHLNGNSTDASGNNNHGTDTAITYSLANGKIAQGAEFNGSSSRVLVPNSATFKPTAAVTVAAWINPTTYADFQGIVTTDGTDSWATTKGYGLVHRTGTDISFWINSSGSNIASTNLATGSWYFVVGTYDKQNVNLYVNGNLVSSDPYTADISYGTEQLAIGSGSGSALYFFNGKLDEVAIFSRALTDAEIRKWYSWSMGRYQ